MAPGYVIAACLEGAGAVGIVLALRLLHLEQRAKAAELARFLRSGHIPDAWRPTVRSVATARQLRLVHPAAAMSPNGRANPSDALLALRSAYGSSAA